MPEILSLALEPAAWAALVALVAMELVLGIDNLIFIAILTNRLPESQRVSARRIGIGLALILRLALLATIAWIVKLTAPVATLFGQSFSWRDMILIAGGAFLVWKATKEIHQRIDPSPGEDVFNPSGKAAGLGFAAALGQIALLDLVFSIDSIITAVGMTDRVPIMVAAVIITVALMLVAATPLANFINANPTIIMLALGFLLMIGTMLVAEGFGQHVPKGYIYGAMAFSALVEGLNMLQRRAGKEKDPH
ncbi:MAG: TerC family protein [Proteobacteria bacterium]|nr:TerC family protein [Pseudomonadota bacterium]